MFIIIYINDLLMFKAFKKKIIKIKQILNDKFFMFNLKLYWYYLKMKII